MVQKVVGSIPISHPICGHSTAVSMRVFQTRDEVSTTSARTIFEFSLIWAVFCCFCGDGECSWCCGGDSS